jgi:hypothetical protein
MISNNKLKLQIEMFENWNYQTECQYLVHGYTQNGDSKLSTNDIDEAFKFLERFN